MQVSNLLADVQAHLEQGAELLSSHIPALVDLAARLEADPFVQAAIATALSPEAKTLVTDLMGRLEALEAARAAQPADPAPEAPAEAPADPAADPAAADPAADPAA